MPTPAVMSSQSALEVFHGAPETLRASSTLAGLVKAAKSAGARVVTTSRYGAHAPVLVIWGPGAPDRAAAMRQHVAGGGHVIAFDLAYWNRDRKVRVSIDAAHPQAWVMRRALSSTRLSSDAPVIRNAWKPTGPIIVAGIGQKAQVQYGAEVVGRWEAEMMAACRSRWPQRTIHLRPKSAALAPTIDRALSGASLVITWHSNVAVDAIRLGIPVVCHDGAAAAVCQSTLPDDLAPLPEDLRDQFLANLAWFQWDLATEGPACWAFLREALA